MNFPQAAKCDCKRASPSLQLETAPSSLAPKRGPSSHQSFPSEHLWFLPARSEAGSWLCNVLLVLAQFCASPGTHGLLQLASALLFYLRICCQNSNELSILRPVIFPPRPCRRLTQGPVATVRRKEDSERILFNFFFFFFLCFTHFCLCLLPGLLPSTAPSNLQASPSLLGPPSPLYVTRSLKLKLRRVL